MKNRGGGGQLLLTRNPRRIPAPSERSGIGHAPGGALSGQDDSKAASGRRTPRGGRPLPEFFVCSFFGRGFASWLAFEAGEGVFEHFSDAAVTGFKCAAIEDAEQPVAALDTSHGLPALIGAGIAREGEFQNGGQVELGFHGGEQQFGGSFGAAEAGCGVFNIGNLMAEPLAHGKGELVEPAAEGAVFVEDALEFPRDGGDRFCRVRHQAEVRRVADGGVAAGPQTLLDEHALVAPAGGEHPSVKWKAVDFAFDADFGARSPNFSDVERDADKNPVESRGDALESGFEGFGHKFGHRFYGESAGKDNIVEGETRNKKKKIRNKELGIRKTKFQPRGGRCSRMKEEGARCGGCPSARITRAKAACAALAI